MHLAAHLYLHLMNLPANQIYLCTTWPQLVSGHCHIGKSRNTITGKNEMNTTSNKAILNKKCFEIDKYHFNVIITRKKVTTSNPLLHTIFVSTIFFSTEGALRKLLTNNDHPSHLIQSIFWSPLPRKAQNDSRRTMTTSDNKHCKRHYGPRRWLL